MKPCVLAPTQHKLGMMVHICTPSTGELEVGRSEVNGDSEFKASWANIRPSLKIEIHFPSTGVHQVNSTDLHLEVF